MRRTALGVLAGWPLAVRARCAAAAVTAETRHEETLKVAEFVDSLGASHRLAELSRPLVLVDLWAEWCVGCREELPTIRWLAAHLGTDALDVVMLSHAMSWRRDVAYLRETGVPFHHWRLSPTAAAAAVDAVFGIEGDRIALPQSIVLAGRDRALVHHHLGSLDWSAPEQVRLVRHWLAAVT